jgi:hypothetical protein
MLLFLMFLCQLSGKLHSPSTPLSADVLEAFLEDDYEPAFRIAR